MKLSVVFSFRNEAETLPELLKRVNDALKDYESELIFVNDASTDDSLAILLEAQKKSSNIRIINMSRQFGVTPCVLAGLHCSTGDAVVYMDCDLQDPPELIPELIDKFSEGFEVIHTIRKTRKGESPLKMLVTKLAYRLINSLSNTKLPINAGDFKLLSRVAVNEIINLSEYDPYLRGMSVWVGFKQAEVFYERDARYSGKSKFGLLSSLNPYKELLRGITSFSLAPLYLSLFLGFSVSLISFVLLVYILVMKLLALNLPGWTAIMTAILFTAGMILFTIGVLGIYVGRIYEQIQGRPRYIIKD